MMRRCVAVLLGVSALVLCISGLPTKVDSLTSLDRLIDELSEHTAEKLQHIDLDKMAELRDAERRIESVGSLKNVDKEYQKEIDNSKEATDFVERAYTDYNPYYSAPYTPTPPKTYSPYAPSYNNLQFLTDPYFHASKPTVAAQNLYTTGNGIAIGTIAADSYGYAPYYPSYSRRRRAVDALNAAVDHLTDKMKNIAEAEDMKKAWADKSVSTVDEVENADVKTGDAVERDYGYYPAPSYGAPYGGGYGGGGYNPYNSYPSGGNYGYQAPNSLDSAKVEQAASSTKSLYMSAGASSYRPTPYYPTYS